jgi:FdhD protein
VRKNTKQHKAFRESNGTWEPTDLELVSEEPLMIRIDGEPYTVVMRTPGQEVNHSAGFCLGEGIIDTADDFDTIGYCADSDQNVIEIRLTPERARSIPDLLQRRSFISQTSCGICGKQLVEELFQKLTPVKSDFTIDIRRIDDCINALPEQQECYKATRGSHAALILDEKLQTIAFAEDVGRHNALDKVIGSALMTGQLTNARILVLSSRISYELVQKAARARLPMIVSYSRPTSLAVEMAKALNMTLVFPDKGAGLVVACNEHRVGI